MKNEILKVYEDKNETIYKRIGREEKGVSLYFSDGGLEFRDIRGVRAFIKSLKIWNIEKNINHINKVNEKNYKAIREQNILETAVAIIEQVIEPEYNKGKTIKNEEYYDLEDKIISVLNKYTK